MLNRKGFIGPIGDDLPSLIPLIFALIIFFATFSFALARYSDMSASFERDLDVVNLSNILRGDSFITGINDFHKKCASLPLTRIKYVAGITNAMTAPEYFEQNLPWEYRGIEYYKRDDGTGGLVFVNENIDEDDELDAWGYDGIDNDWDADYDDDGDGFPDSLYRCSNVEEDEELTYMSSRDYVVVQRIYPITLQQNDIVRPMHLVVVAWTD